MEPGDVVALAGLAAPLGPEAMRATLMVRKADTASHQEVIGVMESRCVFKLADDQEPAGRPEGGQTTTAPSERVVEIITEEAAGHGDCLIVVYQALVRVKVDALDSAIEVGDLRTVCATAGQAMRAQRLDIEGQKHQQATS